MGKEGEKSTIGTFANVVVALTAWQQEGGKKSTFCDHTAAWSVSNDHLLCKPVTLSLSGELLTVTRQVHLQS